MFKITSKSVKIIWFQSLLYATLNLGLKFQNNLSNFEMGNACNAGPDKKQNQIQNQPKPRAIPRVSTSMTSDFLPRMNALFANDMTSQKQNTKLTSSIKYIDQKNIDQEQHSLNPSIKQMFTTILRSQLKAKIFMPLDQSESNTNPEHQKDNLVSISQNLSDQDIQTIQLILATQFLFLQLTPKQKHEVIKNMKTFQVESGAYIFKEGDKAERFFIIAHGELKVIAQGEVKKIMKKGQYFGEIALLFGSKRTASVQATQKCKLWSIDRTTFRKLVEEYNFKTEKENRQFLQNTQFFDNLTPLQQQSVLNVIVILKYQAGQIIIRQKDTINSFFIIKKGDVHITRENGEEANIRWGDQFGLKLFESENSVKLSTAKAINDCVVICLRKDNICEALGSTIENIVCKNKVKNAFQKSNKFKLNLHKNLKTYCQGIIIKHVQKDQKLMKKGHIMKNVYIPFNVKLSSVDKSYQIGQIVQENLFIDNKPLSHGIKCLSQGIVLVVKVSRSLIEEAKASRININTDSISLDNILLIKKVGSGQFGQVFVGLHTPSNSLVAIKSVPKDIVQKLNIHKHIIDQQNVMRCLKHPFILNYYRTIVSKTDVNFIIEYIAGKQFFDVIREIGLLKSSQAQFYISQALLALQYMHNQDIIYRDLKPENIMIDKAGYIKLIDMGTAKQLKKQNHFRTRTVIGTPHYMAPEIISGKGYTFNSDLWSLGVLLYQLLCGYHPYENKNDDPFQIYKLIMNHHLQFPGYMKDSSARQLMFKLLSKTPQNRINKGYSEIKKMSFFNGLDWVALQNKKIPSQYKMAQNVGIDISKVQQNGLESIQKYYEKLGLRKTSDNESQQRFSWEKDLEQKPTNQ